MPLTQLCCCCNSARKTGQKCENTFNGNCGITLSSTGCFLLQQEQCHQPQDAPVALEHQQRLEEAFSWLLQRNKSTAGGWRHRGGFLRLPTAGALCMGGSQGSSPAPSRSTPESAAPGPARGHGEHWGLLLSGEPPRRLRSKALAGTSAPSAQIRALQAGRTGAAPRSSAGHSASSAGTVGTSPSSSPRGCPLPPQHTGDTRQPQCALMNPCCPTTCCGQLLGGEGHQEPRSGAVSVRAGPMPWGWAKSPHSSLPTWGWAG